VERDVRCSLDVKSRKFRRSSYVNEQSVLRSCEDLRGVDILHMTPLSQNLRRLYGAPPRDNGFFTRIAQRAAACQRAAQALERQANVGDPPLDFRESLDYDDLLRVWDGALPYGRRICSNCSEG